MKLKDKISFGLISHINREAGYEIIIPNFYVKDWEMDIFHLRNNDYLVEYEIKTSRQDFLNDFKKQAKRYKGKTYPYIQYFVNKHEEIQQGEYVANKFYFVVPEGLVSEEEVPDPCGLIYYNEKWNSFTTIKPAKFIHKEKYEPDLKKLCVSLSFRELGLRSKLRRLVKR